MDTIIKGIFFDFDGVITREKTGSQPMMAYIASQIGMPYEKVYGAYIKHNGELLRGDIIHEDMWPQFCSELGRSVDISLLHEAFFKITIDENMVSYIRSKKQDCLIGMITDNKADRIEAVVGNTELKDLFDVIIISANVHSRKSEHKIFEEALRTSGLKAEECVFIDNTASNLVAAGELGYTTVFFDDEKRDYGVLP